MAILQPSASAQAFSLKSGDTVVFYGDSITEQNFYNQWVELYTVTRFPAMRVHFYGAGVGGDRVTGGGGGTIDERLARDVFRYKPTVVTVMLGMNDGHNGTTPDEINANYTKGYEHILQSVQQHAPGVRITLLGPSPFDEVTRPVGAKGSYNAVMVHFADVDRELAAKYNASFVDFNTPVVAVLEKAEALDPLAAKLFLPDRVHPDTIVHWVMAEALLKGWNAPALVSSVTIDAAAAKVVDAQNATVDHVERANGTLSWTATENALPLPLMSTNEKDALLIQLTDIQQALNQEPLRVTGLDAAQYTLTIDGKDMGSFSAADLAKGINLADYATPMRSQAQTVGWTMRDREDTHFIHMRMFIKKADTGASAGKPDLMDAFEDMMEDAMYAAATPKPHVFALSVAAVTP
ncbi:MAG: SGNH/GDSL hydrolase family protein [Terracidiphilus sp.]